MEKNPINKPPVVSRTGWGCPDGQASPSWPPQYHTVTHIIIHHTATPNTDTDWPARVRQIWDYHTYTQGWGDIGYNYLIDPNGVIYEGRAGGDDVIAGHAYGHNVGTMGVAFLGTFSTVEPTSAALSSAESLLAWKCDQRDIDPLDSGTDYAGTYYKYIAGHRDLSATECPGDKLYNLLPSIRQDVFNLLSEIQPPSLISPPDGSHQTGSFNFEWSSVPDATNYRLSIKFPGSSSWLSDVTSSTSYPYSPTLLGEFHWKVQAYVGGEWSDYSDEWIFYFDGLPKPTLKSPSNGAIIIDLRPTFEWYPVSGTTSYQLAVARDDLFTDIVWFNLGISGTSWQWDMDLTEGETYYWHVRSGIPIGQWSDPWHFTVAEPTYPPSVTTNAATLMEETTATLNGVITNDGGEACQYRFEYDINSGEPYSYNTGWTGSKTTGQSFDYALSSLNKGTKYYFRAQAKNSAGTASGSELTFLTKPDAPTSFSATTAGTTQIDLSWSKGAGAQKTKIQRKTGSYPANKDDGTQVYFDTGSSTSDIELSPGTTYYYRAWSYVQGSEQWSDNPAEDWATTTSIGAPTVTTNAATDIGIASATLNGYLDDTGGESCQVWFEYGKTTAYGSSTSPELKPSTGSFSKGISGLDDDTPYHFRAVASNSVETDYGDDTTFETEKALKVNFTASNTCFCTNVTFTADITDGTPPYTYRWDFDNDGTYELEGNYPNPSWHYNSQGIYTARLNVTDDSGDSNETTKTVTVYANPQADFAATSSCFCTETVFTDISVAGDGSITNWTWTFGDGETAYYGEVITHHYPAPGVYQVSLTVIDEYGCLNTVLKTVTVYENPIADFTATKVKIGEDTVFTSSVTCGTPPYTYSWDFGDGNTSTDVNPTYRYTAPGIYNVTLNVVDTLGCSDTIMKMVEVTFVPHTDVGVTADVEVANATDIAPYVPPGTDLSNATVIRVNVTDATPENATNDAYTDITIDVGALDLATCQVFKAGYGFLLEVEDVTTLPTVKPPGVAKFARNVANNTVIVRLYAGDPLLAVVPPLSEEKVFDTGKGDYPSISGTHNGTITPFCTISVSKLYTYPCTGTSGHTEYARIYNASGTIAEANWSGYVGDWHNISFDSPFILTANETYNYTIKTGSYPQIHHNRTLRTENGRINCTEFVDVNGMTYNDWIPALTLFS